MATLYPKPLPEHYLHEPEHRAKILFHNRLNDALGDEYRVFYDVAWQSRTDHGLDGQADFVLAYSNDRSMISGIEERQERFLNIADRDLRDPGAGWCILKSGRD